MKLHALALSSAFVFALCAAPGVLASEAKTAFKPDPAKGQQLSAACQACHLADGNRGAPANPILQGQHP